MSLTRRSLFAAPALLLPAAMEASAAANDDYMAFLAHEHRALLLEMQCGSGNHVPMFWFPAHAAIERLIASVPPSLRARRVLAALGTI